MRWVTILVAVGLVLAGVLVGFPEAVGNLLAQGLDAVGQGGLAMDAAGWLDLLRGRMLGGLPWVLIGAGLVLLLAGSLMRRQAPAEPELELVFDFASTEPRYVTHNSWTDQQNETVSGTIFRLGVRNRTGAVLPDVLVAIQLSDGHPANARFVRDNSYCGDIAAHGLELVEIFMMRDRDATDATPITETVTVRATSPGARAVSRRFRFNSAAKVQLADA